MRKQETHDSSSPSFPSVCGSLSPTSPLSGDRGAGLRTEGGSGKAVVWPAGLMQVQGFAKHHGDREGGS